MVSILHLSITTSEICMPEAITVTMPSSQTGNSIPLTNRRSSRGIGVLGPMTIAGCISTRRTNQVQYIDYNPSRMKCVEMIDFKMVLSKNSPPVWTRFQVLDIWDP